MAEHRTLWQAAWGIVATIAGGFVVGLLIANISAPVPLLAIIAAAVVMIVGLYCVFAPVFRWPPFRRSGGESPGGGGVDQSVTSYNNSGITARNVTLDSRSKREES